LLQRIAAVKFEAICVTTAAFCNSSSKFICHGQVKRVCKLMLGPEYYHVVARGQFYTESKHTHAGVAKVGVNC
jgi:hypothetical protein